MWDNDMLEVWYMRKTPYVVWYVLTVWYEKNTQYMVWYVFGMAPWYGVVDVLYG